MCSIAPTKPIWFDERDGNREVYLFVGSERELSGGVDNRALQVTSTPGESIGAYVAWNARRHRFGLVWCDSTEGQHDTERRESEGDRSGHGSPLCADSVKVMNSQRSRRI